MEVETLACFSGAAQEVQEHEVLPPELNHHAMVLRWLQDKQKPSTL